MKEKGILLPIFSLPSKYGIGDFGNEAYEFIDILNENKVAYWAILPINACKGFPYSPISYYALDENYISLDKLIESGLIEYAEERRITDRAIYDNFKEKYYKEAFSNFMKCINSNDSSNCENDINLCEGVKENGNKYSKSDYYAFIKTPEINEYAQFSAEKYGEPLEYYLFLQYILYKQWMEIKNYANSKNIKIIGDMPVYPVFDSVDTKYHSNCFEMENGQFTFESGTPPDYFNNDGQKWNSPVYNVENLRKENYKYLIDRFKYHAKLFDKIRIDYFRGYDSFFKIPIGKSGKEGVYEDGVSYYFFDELFEKTSITPDRLIVEDLGDIREETIELRRYYNFTRQKILQFTIDLYNFTDKDDEDENVLAFPGNHDCNTIYGWYKTLNDEEKGRLHEFLRRHECYDLNVNIGLMQYCMKCKSRIVIITVQDILGLDETTRINYPGTISEKNWSWKLKDFDNFKVEIKHFG